MNYSNFEKHLLKLRNQIYQEPVHGDHVKATREVLEEFCKDLEFNNAVELGSGTAPALDLLGSWGKDTLAVTLGGEVVTHKILREDIHFTDLPDKSFDLVIMRHSLEHSPMPLILLLEAGRISRGYALVVVPVPDERMIIYPNHYSVLGNLNWRHLFKLSNWKVLRFKKTDFSIEPDYIYREYRYLLEKI